MRSVAKALDTGPASLYAHVANKDELDQLVVDRMSALLVIPEPDPTRWDEQLKEMMRAARWPYQEHPGSARASMALIPTGHGALRTAEGMLALCRAGVLATTMTTGSTEDRFEFGLALMVGGLKTPAQEQSR